MDELRLPDADAQQLGRFFADLMVTLAEDDVAGAPSVEAIRALWHETPDQFSRGRLDLDAETVVHGLGAVAAALACQLVSERRAAGRVGASVAEVWREVGRALDPAADYEAAPSSGALDTT